MKIDKEFYLIVEKLYANGLIPIEDKLDKTILKNIRDLISFVEKKHKELAKDGNNKRTRKKFKIGKVSIPILLSNEPAKASYVNWLMNPFKADYIRLGIDSKLKKTKLVLLHEIGHLLTPQFTKVATLVRYFESYELYTLISEIQAWKMTLKIIDALKLTEFDKEYLNELITESLESYLKTAYKKYSNQGDYQYVKGYLLSCFIDGDLIRVNFGKEPQKLSRKGKGSNSFPLEQKEVL